MKSYNKRLISLAKTQRRKEREGILDRMNRIFRILFKHHVTPALTAHSPDIQKSRLDGTARASDDEIMGLELVELAMGFEEEFKIDIPEKVAEALLTPADVIDYFHQESKKRFGELAPSREAIRERVRQVITDQTGIEKFNDEDRFVQDMHLD